jgi:hypothetical protein
MRDEGPLLESLTRRLAECPPEFLDEPHIRKKGRVIVPAVVGDLLVELGGSALAPQQTDPLAPENDTPKNRNRLRLILIACWLLHDLWFREHKQFADAAFALLSTGLDGAADLTPAGKFVTDPDRREELARLCLKELGLRPAGETVEQAQDRLATLNTAERQRVIKAAREAEERARQIREAMARKAAEEAADKWGRE